MAALPAEQCINKPAKVNSGRGAADPPGQVRIQKSEETKTTDEH